MGMYGDQRVPKALEQPVVDLACFHASQDRQSCNTPVRELQRSHRTRHA